MIKSEIKPQMHVEQLSVSLKKIEALKPPEWSHYAKTGTHKEQPPQQADWWYSRAASVLRRIYIDGPVGISRLRTFYGGRKNSGSSPEHFRKAGGKIIRTILQQLESEGLVEKVERNGRRITAKGAKMVESTAVAPEPKVEKKPEPKPEVKEKAKPEEKPKAEEAPKEESATEEAPKEE